MEKLQGSYAPHNETDTTTLQCQLQELSDEIEGGFHEYANQFIQIYTELIKSEVPNIVGETELREWVKAGIKNDQVLNHLAATICRPDVAIQPTFEQIFAHVRGYLTFLGHDKDPYRILSSSCGKISANKARVLTPDRKWFIPDKNHERKEIRCTRCWHTGHRWAMCREQNARCVATLSQPMLSFVLNGNHILNQGPNGYTHLSISNKMVRRVWYLVTLLQLMKTPK
jgi:hypothetical protein